MHTISRDAVQPPAAARGIERILTSTSTFSRELHSYFVSIKKLAVCTANRIFCFAKDLELLQAKAEIEKAQRRAEALKLTTKPNPGGLRAILLKANEMSTCCCGKLV